MECKIFADTNRYDLQQQINKWLQTHPVTSESMSFQLSSVTLTDDEGGQKAEHTLVLFYVPMRMI